MSPKIKALYLSVKNMKRAVGFYEEIFNKEISSFDQRMSSFDFDNITLLLYNPSADGEKTVVGNNVVPNIEVEDAKEMFKKLKDKGLKIVMPLEKIGKHLIFQVKDTEGNTIEFYQTEKKE